jgi:hypothetical protein
VVAEHLGREKSEFLLCKQSFCGDIVNKTKTSCRTKARLEKEAQQEVARRAHETEEKSEACLENIAHQAQICRANESEDETKARFKKRAQQALKRNFARKLSIRGGTR